MTSAMEVVYVLILLIVLVSMLIQWRLLDILKGTSNNVRF